MALGGVEIISIARDVVVEAKRSGSVKIEGKLNVTVDAKTLTAKIEAGQSVVIEAKKKDVKIEAGVNVLIDAKGRAQLHTKRAINLDSKDSKFIQARAGNSTVRVTDTETALIGPKFVARTDPKSAHHVMELHENGIKLNHGKDQRLHITSTVADLLHGDAGVQLLRGNVLTKGTKITFNGQNLKVKK